MGGAAEPRGVVDVDAPVVVVADLNVAGMDAHPDAQRAVVRPLGRFERILCGGGSPQRGTRLAERDEERVAVGVDFDAAVGGPHLAQDLVMSRQYVAVEVADLLQQPRRALDVAEEQGQVAVRQLYLPGCRIHLRPG